jgi:hypothetical protein
MSSGAHGIEGSGRATVAVSSLPDADPSQQRLTVPWGNSNTTREPEQFSRSGNVVDRVAQGIEVNSDSEF